MRAFPDDGVGVGLRDLTHELRPKAGKQTRAFSAGSEVDRRYPLCRNHKN